MKKLYYGYPSIFLPRFQTVSVIQFTKTFLCLFFAFLFVNNSIFSQSLTIGARSYMVMNGAPSLVIKDAALINNGNFSESQSTVKFSGYADTTQSYLSGSNTTTFYNLTTSKSAYGTALKSMGRVRNILSVSSGHLYCDSNLTLLSDAALTARVDVVPANSNIYGKAMVQRYMPPRRAWRLMTAPVTSSGSIFNTWQNGGVYEAGKGTWVTGSNPTGAGGNGLDASPQNNVSMKTFNFNTQAFVNVSNTKVAVSSGSSGNADNTGYFMFVRGDRVYNNFDYSGGVCNTTTLTSIGQLQAHTQTFVTAKDSAKYTLIGNPFASPIDFNNITRNNIVKRFFVLDPTIGSVGSWVMLDDIDGDGVFTKSIGASSMTKEIQSGQAFMVVTNGNVASASVVFEETSKTSVGNTNIMGRPSVPNKIASIRSNLYLLQPDTAVIADGVVTEFDDRYSSKTNQDDASKPSNTNENLTLIRNGLSFSVERRSMLTQNDTIYFKAWRTSQRRYRLEFIPSYLAQTGLQGFLEDSYLKTSTLVHLNVPTTYDFDINGDAASQAMDRFKIVFRPGAVLPVTISNIKAALQTNNTIKVEWKVENEINIVKYEVEKSVDGISFTQVDVTNVNGTNNTSNSYNWIDENAIAGNNFYRIKIVDANGQMKYSSVVKVALEKNTSSISIYPNPIKNNTINIQFSNQKAGTYQVRLINNLGQVLYNNSLQNNEGNSSQVIKPATTLAAGTYQIEIISPDKSRTTQKLFVEQ
ncbi:T9SS type A sorting domain-containing protein [Ferruginibacter lapsinanis]|uniref:T9SS type A sorting domain-containing protein n=1 Tax=Ferruginibacter lapsinanis TaxID=563172 RepID=UPI001E5ADA4D|nr:T9SS type A sorting domain-containing protein [Ferruginibacter lapsinanis]UEG49585.1 T9SS type A sorting domain-containing protein [Ferruginibacter lapsinanis]